MFIHDALLEAITCGVTEVEAKDLGTRIRELRQVDQETGYTYLENEFCRLAKEENHPIAFKSASLNCNASKNRYANILPCELPSCQYLPKLVLFINFSIETKCYRNR